VAFAERIAHVDMDAFFVEVERLDDASLRGRAVVVGGAGRRGVVASASYEARAHGVTSAMPTGRARRLCPGLIVISPSHGRYGEVSRRVFEVLGTITPDVDPVSVDEAFLDVSGLRLLYPTAVAVGVEVRRRIRTEISLPSSVGMASTRLLAKMASRDAKPDGLAIIAAGEEIEYLHPKPVRDLWGVGAATHRRLEALGVETVGDVAVFPRETLQRRLGESVGGLLWDLASGIDSRSMPSRAESRSISVEQTYEHDLVAHDDLEKEMLRHADRLAGRLRRASVMAMTVAVKVRYEDFTTVSRSKTFDVPVMAALDLYEAAVGLLARTGAGARPVRLLGIAAEGLVDADVPRQMTLADGPREDLEDAVEQIRDRFGREAVARARLAEGPTPGGTGSPDGTPRKRGRSV